MVSDNSIISVNYHWDLKVIIITSIVLIILLSSIVLIFYLRNLGLWIRMILVIPLIFTIFYCASSTPLSLRVDSYKIQLKKFIGSIDIPLKEVESISLLSADSLNNSIRVFGSGGFFGYLGVFKNETLGKYSIYITERQNLIILKTQKKTYVFNCRESAKFIPLVVYLKQKQQD